MRIAGGLDVPVEALFDGILREPVGGGPGMFRVSDPPELPRLSSARS